jgi:hypothetical protein
MSTSKMRQRIALTIGVILAVMIGGVVGGTGTGNAATSFNITLAPLIGTSDVNVIPQVSYGGKIGYHLHVDNNGDSTTQHGSIVVTSNLATFSDSDNASCVVNSKDSHQMVCTPFGGTFAPGATFDVNLRFTAPLTGPAAGEQVSTQASITVSAQTVGGNKSNGTTIAQSASVPTTVVENTTKADTYLHGGEGAATSKLSAAHPQNFGVTLPETLFGSPFGVALSIHDNVGTPICATCLPSWTTLTIPVASFATNTGNPFFDGTNVNAYSWSMNAQYPSGFKLTGIVHVDDASVTTFIPNCSSIGGAPTATDPVCYDTLVQIKNTKTISSTGRGIENGNLGYG